MAKQRLYELKKVWTAAGLSTSCRNALVKRCVLPRGIECCRIGHDGVKKIAVFLNDCRRAILNLWRGCMVTCEELETRAPLGSAKEIVAKRTLNWIERAEKDDVLLRLMKSAETSKGKVGRPMKSFLGYWREWCQSVIEKRDETLCDLCGKTFINANGVAIHKAKKHRDPLAQHPMTVPQTQPTLGDHRVTDMNAAMSLPSQANFRSSSAAAISKLRS